MQLSKTAKIVIGICVLALVAYAIWRALRPTFDQKVMESKTWINESGLTRNFSDLSIEKDGTVIYSKDPSWVGKIVSNSKIDWVNTKTGATGYWAAS